MYVPRRSSVSEFASIRFMNYHLRVWGRPSAQQTPLVLLHGWMDVSASWQFVVDAMASDRWIVAPDWRGFGLTRQATPGATPFGNQDHYWFGDYLGDLDALIDRVTLTHGGDCVDLVGHSMGGNVAMLYSGIRPQRVRRLVNLEGFGMAATRPEEAPARYAQWMDQLKARHQGALDLRGYDSPERVAHRLMKSNPRLCPDKAHWLAQQWAQPDAHGRWHVQGDAGHKVISAMLYRVDEALACYRRISAPVLAVEASENLLDQRNGEFTIEEYRRRLKEVPHCQRALVPDAAHMLHHDQPEVVAGLIEQHLA